MKIPPFLLAVVLAINTFPAYGQLTWGVNGAGGSGTWNTSTANWWNGTSNVAWISGGEAVFAGTPGTVAVSGSVTASKLTFNAAGYAVNSFFIRGVAGGITVEANADATIGSSVFAASTTPGTFRKTGAARLTFTRAPAFFDQVAVDAGEIYCSGSSTDAFAVYSLANSPGVMMTLGSGSSSYSVGGLSGGGANGGVVRPENVAGTKTLVINSTTSGGSFAGILQDNGAGILALSSSGAQELTAANSYSGATTVRGGTLTFSQGGTALNSGGTLLLDNTALNVADRLSDTFPITVAGTLALRGNATASSNETLGPLHFGATRGAVSITPNAAQPAAFVFDSLAPRAAGQSGVIDFQGAGLGSAAGPGVSTVRFTNAPALVGGNGNEGTPNLGILPAALGSVASGTTFVTYGANGIRPLTDAEYTNDLLSAGALGNVGIATAIDVSGSAAINALRLKAGGSVGGSGTLAISSGMILAQPGSGSLTVGALDFGGAEAIVIAESDLTIGSAIIGGNPINGLTKAGAGRLTLTGNSNYTGATNVAGGTLSVTNQSALGDAAGAVTVRSGAAFELQGSITFGAKPLTVIGSGPGGAGSLRSHTGDNAWNGAVSLQSVTVGVDAGSLTFGGGITAIGRWFKTGSGSLVLANGVDSRFADLSVFAGPIVSHATTGIPFTDGSLALYGTPVSFAPAGAGGDVALSEGGNVFGSTTSVVSFNQGNSTLSLDKGANNTLTLTLARLAPATIFARGSSATLVIAANGGMAGLGTTEKLIAATGPQPIPLTNGIVTPAILGQDNDASRSADFLTYNTTAGLLRAAYSASMSLQNVARTPSSMQPPRRL